MENPEAFEELWNERQSSPDFEYEGDDEDMPDFDGMDDAPSQ